MEMCLYQAGVLEKAFYADFNMDEPRCYIRCVMMRNMFCKGKTYGIDETAGGKNCLTGFWQGWKWEAWFFFFLLTKSVF